MGGESVGYFLSVEIKINSFCFLYGIFLRTLPSNMKQVCREYLHVTNLIR